MGDIRPLTDDEQRAIKALRRLAKIWPPTLKLFSWSGSLVVMDSDVEVGTEAVLADGFAILNDGVDP